MEPRNGKTIRFAATLQGACAIMEAPAARRSSRHAAGFVASEHLGRRTALRYTEMSASG